MRTDDPTLPDLDPRGRSWLATVVLAVCIAGLAIATFAVDLQGRALQHEHADTVHIPDASLHPARPEREGTDDTPRLDPAV